MRYLRQTFINIGVRLVHVVRLEVDKNPNMTWRPQKKGSRDWRIAIDARSDLDKVFHDLAFDDRFQDIEFTDFTWRSKQRRVICKRRKVDVEPLGDFFVDIGPPPPPFSQPGRVASGTGYPGVDIAGADISDAEPPAADASGIGPHVDGPPVDGPPVDGPDGPPVDGPSPQDSSGAGSFDAGPSVDSHFGADLSSAGPYVTGPSEEGSFDEKRPAKRLRQ